MWHTGAHVDETTGGKLLGHAYFGFYFDYR